MHLPSTDPHDTCSICEHEYPRPELCCVQCDAGGLAYHESCWMQERHHRREANPPHRRILMKDFQTQLNRRMTFEDFRRLSFLTEPNKRTSIEDKNFQDDYDNCFVEFNVESKGLQFGPRAHPLLRGEHSQRPTQYPSFVSFIGRTANGKSYLLRALLDRNGEANHYPAPIPAPGAKANLSSTSSDIYLYADYNTADGESPILFLDCEGLDGSDTPISFAARTKNAVMNPINSLKAWNERREYVEEAYPRFVYAFSTCVVFVTTGPPAEAASIGRRLLRSASQGASGSKNQGFKPSLFIVFNCFRDDIPDFDWSISSSTEAFLSLTELEDLKLFYHEIRVVYIPTVKEGESGLALSQITAFQKCLREDHESAFRRRQEFGLTFTPGLMAYFLARALNMFSKSRSSMFDWSFETSRDGFGSSEVFAAYKDLWFQCTKHYTSRAKTAWELYRSTRETFEKAVDFCLRLRLARGRRELGQLDQSPATIPPSMEIIIQHVDQLLLDHAPCAARVDSFLKKCAECRETRLRHGDHHQGPNSLPLFPAARWQGCYEPYENSPFQTFRQSFETSLNQRLALNISSLDVSELLPEGVRSTNSCFGCLQSRPGTFLVCGHAFCADCIRELSRNHPLPHRLPSIFCPFHQSKQTFSPRLLPIQSGYRILSLDGGGAKGLAELVMLRQIEGRCFQIPTKYLYDLIVGTSVGGVITLALTVGSAKIGNRDEPSLTVAEAAWKFKDFARNGFDNESEFREYFSAARWFSDAKVYRSKSFEEQLRRHFGKITTVYFMPCFPQPFGTPNVAVTTVLPDQFQPHLLANYNRNAIPGAFPLLSQPDLDACMPIWAAARCTSAAAPHLDPFLWQKRMFLDGGFQLSCPAAAALSEAESIWPGRRRDVLVSLGTGKPAAREQHSLYDTLKFGNREVVVDDSAEDLWENFRYRKHPDVFRLNPVHNGVGFALTDFEKHSEMEKQTEAWLASDDVDLQLTLICDHLIAALFYFHKKELSGNILYGEIRCRLPLDLEARQNLFHAMQCERDQELFLAELGNGYSQKITVAGTFDNFRPKHELRILVALRDLPAVENEMEITIRMRNIGPARASTYRWCEISGSPYIL